MQFLGPFAYRQLDLETCIQGGIFVSQFKQTLEPGWKQALLLVKEQVTGKEQAKAETQSAPFPVKLKQGDKVTCIETHIQDKQTTPPKRFTDASLLAAMTGIARYVQAPEIRKILRETDGLGTEATRASIIELLFSRGFLNRKGKEIQASPIGRELINKLPERLSLPDMTAQWEAQLNAISQRELGYQGFMAPMQQSLNQLIVDVSRVQFEGLQGQGKAAFKPRKKTFRKRTAKA